MILEIAGWVVTLVPPLEDENDPTPPLPPLPPLPTPEPPSLPVKLGPDEAWDALSEPEGD